MRAVITVIGQDAIGIVARIAGKCAQEKINILQMEQQIMEGVFTMILLGDLGQSEKDFPQLADDFHRFGREIGLEVQMRNETTFKVMNELER